MAVPMLALCALYLYSVVIFSNARLHLVSAPKPCQAVLWQCSMGAPQQLAGLTDALLGLQVTGLHGDAGRCGQQLPSQQKLPMHTILVVHSYQKKCDEQDGFADSRSNGRLASCNV